MALGVAHEHPKIKGFQDPGNIKKIETLNLFLSFNASIPPQCHTFLEYTDGNAVLVRVKIFGHRDLKG